MMVEKDLIDRLIKESGLESRVSEVIKKVRDSKDPIDILVGLLLDAKKRYPDLSKEELREERVYKFALLKLLDSDGGNCNSLYGGKDKGYSNVS